MEVLRKIRYIEYTPQRPEQNSRDQAFINFAKALLGKSLDAKKEEERKNHIRFALSSPLIQYFSEVTGIDEWTIRYTIIEKNQK